MTVDRRTDASRDDPPPERRAHTLMQAAAYGKRRQKTWYVTEELADRIAAAAYWALPTAIASSSKVKGQVVADDVPDSASAIVEAGLWAEVVRLEELLNSGQPFPPAPGPLRAGPGKAGIIRMKQQHLRPQENGEADRA